MYKLSDNRFEILIQHPPGWDAWTHYDVYHQLQATYNLGEINLALVEPTIIDTDWQGAIINEDVSATITIDGQQVGSVDIIGGQVVFDIELLSGTHTIKVTAPDCKGVVLEVTI